ncbi:MAG TPA: DUF2383 domain-containing protein [Chloroflexia bacterium]|nr:DUF2383 domain-containing protein [Chloroflexia bacterium]
MSNKRTIRALEELIKTEHMAIGALDAALEEVDDRKLAKQYRKFRDSHGKQAAALNDRLEELGGEPIEYEVGSGKGHAGLFGRLTSMRDDTSLAGMRLGAERGIKRYIDNIDDVDDAKALGIIRKNLESKQDEMRWYDDHAAKERVETAESKLVVSKEKAMEVEHTNGKKKGGFPFPLLLIAGAIGAAAFFLLRRNEDDDYDDFGEDAFSYEGESIPSDASYGGETSS